MRSTLCGAASTRISEPSSAINTSPPRTTVPRGRNTPTLRPKESVVSKRLFCRRSQSSVTVAAQTLVVAGSGILWGYSVTVAGSAAGTVNNAATAGAAAAMNALVVTPATVGAVQTLLAFNTGLVLTPGSGQSVNVTYSLG